MRLGKYGKLLHFDNTSLGVGNIKRFIIFEFKPLGGIIINVFNTDTQNRFHSHAFWAFSWMVRGWYNEEVIEGNQIISKIVKPCFRFIPRNYIHKIQQSSKNAVSITFEGPWHSTWNEYFDDGRIKTYTWGRKVLFDSKYQQMPDKTSELDALKKKYFWAGYNKAKKDLKGK